MLSWVGLWLLFSFYKGVVGVGCARGKVINHRETEAQSWEVVVWEWVVFVGEFLWVFVLWWLGLLWVCA